MRSRRDILADARGLPPALMLVLEVLLDIRETLVAPLRKRHG